MGEQPQTAPGSPRTLGLTAAALLVGGGHPVITGSTVRVGLR